MNRTDLIDTVATAADLSKQTATQAVDLVLAGVTDALKRGEAVRIPGFGSFAVAARPARQGRNPKTGATITIAAAKAPRFKPGKALKDALNG